MSAPRRRRALRRRDVRASRLSSGRRDRRRRRRCGRAVGGQPAGQLVAPATPCHALAIDFRDDVTVTAQQRLGRAHFRARRKLALRQPIAPVLLVLGLRPVRLGTTGAERALVHLAAHAEGALLRKLRRAERTGIEAIAAPDAQILVVQHDTFLGTIEAIDRAHRHARRVGAVHARDRDRALAGHAVVDGDHTAAVNAPGYVVLLLAGCDAAVALDAALGVA